VGAWKHQAVEVCSPNTRRGNRAAKILNWHALGGGSDERLADGGRWVDVDISLQWAIKSVGRGRGGDDSSISPPQFY